MATIPVVIPGYYPNGYMDLGTDPLAVTGQSTFTGTATVVSASGANLSTVKVVSATVTLTGAVQVTTAQGTVTIGINTLTDSMAETVDSYSSLYVQGEPVAAGSVTITAQYAVNVAAGRTRLTPTVTVASAAAADIVGFRVAAATVTLTGTTQVTTVQGFVAIGIPTLTDSMSVTVDSYATLYVAGPPVASGSVTLTTPNAVNIAAGRFTHTPTRTVASATSAELSGHHIAAATITLTGTTQTTTATGFVRIGQATLTDGSGVTVDTYASLYIADAPVQAGMVTLTAAYALWVDAGNVRLDGNLTVSGGTVTLSAAATSNVIIANTAAAWRLFDGTVAVINVDTRNTITGINTVSVTSPAMTIVGASGTTYSQVAIGAHTVTTSTMTGITALNGLGLSIGANTVAQSGGAVTVTTASALYVQKVVAGSMVTITNNYLINTDTAGCFCTAAGVWTDTSTETHKESIATVAKGKALAMLDSIRAVEFRYRPEFTDGVDTERYGVIAEEVPEFLASPGHNGVAAQHLAGYVLAVVKDLADQLAMANKRIEALGG